jgi:hypothetical protein
VNPAIFFVLYGSGFGASFLGEAGFESGVGFGSELVERSSVSMTFLAAVPSFCFCCRILACGFAERLTVAQAAYQQQRCQYGWNDSPHPHIPLVHPQKSFIPFTVLQLDRGWLVTPVLDPWILHRQTFKVMRGSLHCYKNEAKRKVPQW